MKKILSAISAALALAVSAAESPEPKLPEIKDPNPYADYGAAMRSEKGSPMAVDWQAANAASLEKAVSKETLAKLSADEASIAALLAQVKEAYATDPVVATQIAAISQRAMCAKCPKAPALRARWTAGLLKAAKESTDSYRTLYFLDQIRWCGYPADTVQVKEIGAKSSDKAVKDFAALVSRELEAAK